MKKIKPQLHSSTEIIARLFPPAVSGLILPIENYLSHLSNKELEIVRNASDKRKFEFSTGRWCAKQLLTNFKTDDIEILSGDNREPIWPNNFIGSISHCKDQCGAVIADESIIQSIGFDIETRKILKHNIAKVICTDDEKDWINKQSSQQYDNLVLLLFSLKESVYKCVFQHQQIKLGFKDCTIKLNFEDNTAQIQFAHHDIHNNIDLKFHSTDTHVYTCAIYRCD